MCLPVTPYKIEKEWKHAGLSCAVTMQKHEGSYRCGYVRVPPGHPAHGKSEVDFAATVNVNLAEIEPCTEHQDGQGWWFGFDCGGTFDYRFDPSIDPDSIPATWRGLYDFEKLMDGLEDSLRLPRHYWTQPEVEAECERLAEQLSA